MRNREQIYGQEAAELLRNITVYHCMRRDQLLRLYPGKEGVIENLLRYLVKQQRIFYNTGIATEMSLTAARTEN